MFSVIYEFTVKKSQNEVFEAAWAEFTEAIFRARGSLGSRLHKTENSQIYIAYAHWPSEEVFDDNPGDAVFTKQELASRERMRDSLEDSKVLHRLHICDDRLRGIE